MARPQRDRAACERIIPPDNSGPHGHVLVRSVASADQPSTVFAYSVTMAQAFNRRINAMPLVASKMQCTKSSGLGLIITLDDVKRRGVCVIARWPLAVNGREEEP